MDLSQMERDALIAELPPLIAAYREKIRQLNQAGDLTPEQQLTLDQAVDRHYALDSVWRKLLEISPPF